MSNKNNNIMQYFKINILTIILLAVMGGTTYAQQDTTKSEIIESEITEIDALKVIDSVKVMDYISFKCLRDREMSAFLKENDAESFEIFLRGEKQGKMGKSLFIPGIVITGIGVGIIVMGGLVIPLLLSLVTLSPDFFLGWWENNNIYPFLKVGLPIFAAGQPFLITSIVLWKKGNILKETAKNNYENKFFKNNTTTLNFNLYPNGLGVSLKF